MGQIKTLIDDNGETDIILAHVDYLMDQKLCLQEGITELLEHLIKVGDREGQKIISKMQIKLYQI